MKKATVEVQNVPYEIGDIAPYKNTASKTCRAKVTGFQMVDNGKIWFRGFDQETAAEVFYPVHLAVLLTP